MVVDLSNFTIELFVNFWDDELQYGMVCSVCKHEEDLNFNWDGGHRSVSLEDLVQLAIKHQHTIKAPV